MGIDGGDSAVQITRLSRKSPSHTNQTAISPIKIASEHSDPQPFYGEIQTLDIWVAGHDYREQKAAFAGDVGTHAIVLGKISTLHSGIGESSKYYIDVGQSAPEQSCLAQDRDGCSIIRVQSQMASGENYSRVVVVSRTQVHTYIVWTSSTAAK